MSRQHSLGRVAFAENDVNVGAKALESEESVYGEEKAVILGQKVRLLQEQLGV
jgi:hypothetical protein